MADQRYFFCHLPKTGGMSTLVSLIRHFGEDAIYPLPEDRENVDAMLDVDHLRTVFEARGHEIKVVVGHFPMCTTELLGAPFRSFTILRDPVERTLSHLRYQRRIDPRFAEMSMTDAYAVPQNLFGAIHNQMVKMLGMTTSELTAGAMSFVVCNEDHLARAKSVLDAMDVVGVQPDFSAFIAELEHTYGWDVGEPAHVNTTSPVPVDPEFTARIAHDSALDVELYRYAQQLVAERSAAACECCVD